MGGGVRDRPPNQWEASYWIIIYYLQSQCRLPDQIPTSCCQCAECVAGPQLIAYFIQINYWMEKYQLSV